MSDASAVNVPGDNGPPVDPLSRLKRATGGAALGGQLREKPDDFRVTEIRPEPLTGEGEHWIFTIEKIGITTEEAASRLARLCGCTRRDIGYAGMKDRHAVTVQDFSLRLGDRPPPEPGPLDSGHESGTMTLLKPACRHRRKIRIGHLAGNAFVIRLRNPQSDAAARQRAEAVVDQLRTDGVPNYFGSQRFGVAGDNAERGRALLARGPQPSGGKGRRGRRGGKQRKREGIWLSAVRSELFNRVLDHRLRTGHFNRLLMGDIAQLNGRSGCFRVEDPAAEMARFRAGEIHPTGPLFGADLMMPTEEGVFSEEQIATEAAEDLRLLTAFGLKGARRALRVMPEGLKLQWEADGNLLVSFSLPRGAYATVVMREFMTGDAPAT